MSFLCHLKSPIVVVVGTQLLFTVGDLMARANMRKHGFTAAAFLNLSFLVYIVSRQIATVGQLYVLATMPLGKTMALFGAASIVLANVLGVLLLGDFLSPRAYLGIALAVLAFVVMGIGK
jgi:multidrug transporter EmrE-like cation transporter